MRIAALACCAVLAGTTVTSAQSRCGPRQAILDIAWQQYDERPVATALAAGGSLIEVLASRDGHTFTMLHTGANGRSCIMATGESWQSKDWQPPDAKAPSS